MRPDEAADPKLLGHYEGLIRATAWRYVEHCEEDYDDICQLFRIKAWKALLSFDPLKVNDPRARDPKGRTAQDRYVYACIKNQGKDLVKRVRRNWSFIEDMATAPVTGFEDRYMTAAEEEVHRIMDTMPTLPSTLSPDERQIVTLLYLDFDNGEIAAFLNWTRKEVVLVVRRIREKMADWKPTRAPASDGPSSDQQSGPAQPKAVQATPALA